MQSLCSFRSSPISGTSNGLSNPRHSRDSESGRTPSTASRTEDGRVRTETIECAPLSGSSFLPMRDIGRLHLTE
ncbi:hypothetical protein BD626DRAFT_505168 [Schizophyllum amplum]|uniref:Uncharacterized protein n=1 Tax=Schizophyllum amplum TaxID=97359 RepID=A0A550C6G3_9AGAR|nr:hypothetical protein BD626DRAFT_505168 [Auriculariopsis ampla]